MAADDPKTLVSTDWLATHLKDPDLRLLDASWHMPGSDRDARAEYDAGHIPGARFFDIDEISDLRSPLPHMVPRWNLLKFRCFEQALALTLNNCQLGWHSVQQSWHWREGSPNEKRPRYCKSFIANLAVALL